MTILTIAQAKGYAAQAGFVGDAINIIVSIGICESNLNTLATNTTNNVPPSTDRGWLQINSYWHSEVTDTCTFDPLCAAKEAYRISSGGTNFNPWNTYKNGCYLKHLDAVRQGSINKPMPTIEQHPIGQCGYWGQMYSPVWFVVHFTGGTPNLPSLYNYWVSQCNIGPNSHFGIERVNTSESKPGDIWQFLPTSGGAAANCCVESGHAPFLPNINLNTRTISVECINPDTGNLGAMPQAQFDSLVYLISTICAQMNIPTNIYTEYWNDYETAHTWGNETGGVIMHRDIAPHNRRMCPGDPYYNGQMDAIMAAVRNGGVSTGDGNMAYLDGIKDKNGWIIRAWESYYQRLNQTMAAQGLNPIPIPRRDTDIFNLWKAQMLKGMWLGGVMSEEWNYEGKMYQDFTACQCRATGSTIEVIFK